MVGDLLDRCTCAALRRAARHLTQAYDKGLAPAGLRTSQYSLLSHLASAGPRSVQALARDMGLDRTTLARNVQPLQREGLVALQVDSGDRRGKTLHVTPLGRARLSQADILWESIQSRFASAYGPEPARKLHSILDELARIEIA